MAPTTNAMYSQNSSQNGLTLATAFPEDSGQNNPQNLDLIKITSKQGDQTLINVDYTGVVHNPALNPTMGVRVGKFATNFNAASGATTAQLFADAFANPSQSDILQVINAGGNIHYYLNYQGVATGS